MKNPFAKNGAGHKAGESNIDDESREIRLIMNRLKAHFVNNALSTIYYLCSSDPEKAQEVTLNLSGYMLAALGTFENRDMVSFGRELDLIRNYLALEKFRFDDKLNFVFDIDVDDFMVPPLTIHALVENSVKRGIAEKNAPGKVRIESRRLPGNGIQIKIIDDGVGFDVNEKMTPDSELAYLRDALRSKIKGDLSIESTPGEGTTATIVFYPD